MNFTAREQALLGYVATIALDPKVIAARAPAQWQKAVLACLAEDLPVVARVAIRGVTQKLIAKAEPAIGNLIDGLFQKLDGALSNRRR